MAERQSQKITNSKFVCSESKGRKHRLTYPKQRSVCISVLPRITKGFPHLLPLSLNRPRVILSHFITPFLESRVLLNICLFLPRKIPNVNVGHIIPKMYLFLNSNLLKNFPM